MHPIERLRYVARASGYDAEVMVREAAAGLLGLGGDQTELVTACRRMVDRQVSCAPLWWLAARLLTTTEPRAEARRAVAEIGDDRSAYELAAALPDGATICVVGHLGRLADALVKRADCRVLLVDTLDESAPGLRRLDRADVEVVEVPAGAIAPAVRASNVLLLDGSAIGPQFSLVPLGGGAAAAVARMSGVPTWVLAGAGHLLPGPMFDAMARRYANEADAWDLDMEDLEHSLVDQLCGPDGPEDVAAGLRRTDCPIAPELFRSTAF